MKASFADTPFPQVVQRLVGADVTSYTADLVKLRNTYYGAAAEAYDEALPLRDGPAIAPKFNSTTVAATVKSIQRGEIGYAEFLRRIMGAGCSLRGIHLGPQGDVFRPRWRVLHRAVPGAEVVARHLHLLEADTDVFERDA